MVVARDEFGHWASKEELVEGRKSDAVLLLVLDAEHPEAVPAEGLAEPVLGERDGGVLAGLHLDDATVVELLDLHRGVPKLLLDTLVQLLVDLHDAELALLVGTHGVDLVVVGDEDGVVLAQTHVFDFEIQVGVDHRRVLDLAAELGVHPELPFVVVSPQEEPLALGDACAGVESALDLGELAAFELSWELALEVLLRET